MSPRFRADHVLGTVRSRVPERLVPRVVALRTRRARADPATRVLSEKHLRFLLEKSRPELDPTSLVDDYIEAIVRRSEERWHPSMMARCPVRGVEHLTQRDGGVVLNFMHHGQYDGMLGSLYREGVTSHIVLNNRHFDGTEPAALLQQMALIVKHRMAGAPPLDAAEGARPIITKLRQGEVVAIATDVAGKAPLTFCGRRVLGSDGAARIAHSTGAPVVVVTNEDGGPRGQVVRVHPPLDPREHATATDLLQAMVAIHEKSILAWPAMADQPARRWHIVDDADQFPPPMD